MSSAAFLSAQISKGGRPLSFNSLLQLPDVPEFRAEKLNTVELQNEDELEAQSGIKSWRFGSEQMVQISANELGSWADLPNGQKIWRLKLVCANALSLNFIFNHFRVPGSGRFYVYSSDKKQVLGAYTSDNHNPDGNFATWPIESNEVILEYNGPDGFELELKYIVRGYKNFDKTLKAFGTSGACNVNVNCPQGADWEEQIRSVVMLLTANNTRFCSGALVNNTANDFTPYVLTANHCGVQSTNIFMFNYQSPQCSPNQDGPTNNTLQGCVRVANSQGTDFALARLNNSIPDEFDVYFNGWSRQSAPPQTSTCIHHPDGDVKKITLNTNETTTGTYIGADCWRIPDWELGTTEPGSSGSPLFNENKQIIGQLYGGEASCSNNVNDYYGRFVISWNGSQANRRLRDWLDPLGSDTIELNGLNANGPKPDLDLRMVSIDVPENENCDALSIKPVITVRNFGNLDINQFIVVRQLGSGSPVETTWNGTLAPGQSTTVEITSFPVTLADNQNIKIYTKLPNGLADERPQNDTLTKIFNNRPGKRYVFRIKSDNYPEETGFQLRNTSNQLLYSLTAGNLSGGTTDFIFCLPKGCYTLRVTDTFGDGICCQGGNGLATLFNDLNQTIGTASTFTFDRTINFCVDTILNINDADVLQSSWSVLPNPANEYVQILTSELVQTPVLLEMYSAAGALVYSTRQLPENGILSLTPFSNGMYIIKLSQNGASSYKRLVISR